MIRRRHWLKGAALALGMVLAGAVSAPVLAADKVTVFAAASLKNALDAINGEWLEQTGKDATVSYAASSALAKQIEQGAPADIFISADLAWMDHLADKKLIKADTRANLLGNRIVLVSGETDAPAVEITPGLDLAGLLGDGRLAMGAVDSVPAGKYGKAALEKLGLWPSIAGKVAGAESVRAALLLVSRGEAPYGIVYRTDAAADANVKVVGTFPEDSHPPIVYPIAITADSRNPDAAAYLDFVRSPKAAALFQAEGFTVLD
ncbi:molybdate ABC transporter substrate-binding protein [Mesorhizobium plurifarium]|uniref:molybdate ABC transporter substrate-binding protein n=1 Tax=Sinorhizobium arboris TaxID=76745 RepID=UPI000D4FC3BD|nr:molybdate ABC transporter substrate-binding protein [Sinorhizobium arboris]PST18871.1 molybdate ABC transporter substrate-binding protein [Mesorhizobium plurifarium]